MNHPFGLDNGDPIRVPTIATFYGVVVQMFWRDHNPPHFHASYGGDEVLIEIETLAVIEALS